MQPIPLVGNNIYLAAQIADISVDELTQKIRESEAKFKKEKDLQWTLDALKKDQKWYDETLKKIEQIGDSLPEDMGRRERIKKMYGWLEDEFQTFSLLIPLEEDVVYSRAYCIMLILHNPSKYFQAISWD